MDKKELLRKTRQTLHEWVWRCEHETVHLDRRMEILMLALADICEALALEDNETKVRSDETIQN
jgi:hypothetical protein